MRFQIPRPGEVLPGPLADQLGLTEDQKKQLAALQKETDEKLEKLLTDEQRKQAMASLKYAGAMITADPNAQQMLNEHGGGGYVTYFQSFMPDVSPQVEGGGEAPPPQATTAPPRPGSAGDAPGR